MLVLLTPVCYKVLDSVKLQNDCYHIIRYLVELHLSVLENLCIFEMPVISFFLDIMIISSFLDFLTHQSFSLSFLLSCNSVIFLSENTLHWRETCALDLFFNHTLVSHSTGNILCSLKVFHVTFYASLETIR